MYVFLLKFIFISLFQIYINTEKNVFEVFKWV